MTRVSPSLGNLIFSWIERNRMQQAHISLTAADLADLARDPSNEVIIDEQREPWDPVRVGDCIRAISGAHECSKQLALLLETTEISEFRDSHPRLYELSQTKDKRVLNFLQMMLDTRVAVNAGKLSHEAAAVLVIDGIRANGAVGVCTAPPAVVAADETATPL